MFAGSDVQIQVLENRLIGPVGKVNIVKNHLPLRLQAAGAAAVNDLLMFIKEFANAFHRGESGLELGEALRQLPQGIKQPLGIKDEGGEHPQAHGFG